MPLQNRVDPCSKLHAVPNKGHWMGNRGRLHDANRKIIRPHTSERRWISCSLSFKGIERKLMSPTGYTELFFLDEATAYAAGHRPCADCRRQDYNAFRTSWARAFPDQQDQSAGAIDRILHAARLGQDGSQRTWRSPLASLPDGSMIEHEGNCLLLWQGRQWLWSFTGYRPAEQPLAGSAEVSVLTPEPIVRLFTNGLSAQPHFSLVATPFEQEQPINA